LWFARPRLASATAAIAALAALAIVLGLVRDAWALQRTWGIGTAAGAWLLGIVVLAALVGLALRAPATSVAAGLVGLAIGWSLAVDGYQFNATYSTTYWYGTSGTVEAANWVDSHLAPGQTYLAAKEVAVRSRDQRYVDQDNLVYALGIGRRFDGTWAGEPLRALVTWQREPYIAQLFDRALSASNFHPTARFGDYVIYEPAPDS
jgi:hypothetical protein